MSWRIPLSNSTGVSLAVGDNVYVAEDIDIFVEDSDCIHGFSQGHQIIVEGRLISGGAIVIDVGNLQTSDSHNTISIASTGKIIDLGDTSDAVQLIGLNNSVDNAGLISGTRRGITLAGNGVGTTHLVNTGTIKGGEAAIARNGSDATETVIFENSGTLLGPISYSASDTAPGVDQITNTGKMMGGINLGANSDYYDGRKGYVDGAINGGSGNDTIFAGKENNTIDGGAGIDSIYGGAGADQLAGGADADIFLFMSVKDSTVALKGQDTITDFAHGDLLELQSIDFNIKKAGLQHAHWIGANDFSHVAGELRYEKTASDTHVYADTNGDGKADFTIHLDGAIKLNIHDVFL